MINKEQIHKFKGRRRILMHRLSTAMNDEEEEDISYYERRLKALDLEEKDAWKDDLTQPSEDRYRTLYPNQYAEMEKGREGQQQAERADKKQREDLLYRFRHNLKEKQALTKLFNKEDAKKYG